jgi:GGDEF domain-containing protein
VRQGQLFARYGGEEFVLVLPETTREQAVQTAERLRQMVQNCAFQFADRRIPVTISCGVAAFSGDETDERGLLEIADRNLYRAKEAGRNRVVADGSSDGGPLGVRRVEDAEILLLNLLSAERPYCVAAFDLADERALVECLGSSRRDDWTRELVEDARAAIAPTDFVARHEGRYLVLALDETLTNRDAKALTESVREKWCRREVPAAGAGRIVRKLHVALLGSAEVRVHGARTWDKLIGRLVPESAGGRRADWEGLPGPVALALAEMDASETELGRILAASWAIEMGLRTLAAVGVACGRRNAERRMALAAIVHRFIGKKLSLGGWLDFALDLAKVVSGAPPPLDPVFAGLRDAGADSAPLAVVLREAVEIRNRNYGHARPAADDAFRTEAVRARVIAEQFAKHLTPLSAVFLVSVASIASLKPGGRKKYRLHVHRGCSTGPVVQEHELKTDLFSDWCYLLFPGEQEPLLLAPLMLAGVAEGGRRAETFHADELKLGPEGTLVRGRSVLTKDEFRAELPWTEEASRLFEALNVLGTPGKAGAEETIRIGDEKKE